MIQKGDVLDGMYQIIKEIGRGGMGIIYLAEHLRLQKKVVVKKIKDHFVGQVNGRGEVDILKGLHHSYLPQVFDFLVIRSSIYTVMEYVEGQDLQQYLNQGCRFPERVVKKWLLQLCEVLDYLHTHTPPILHSDIKPSNIMITKNGDVCLIDFNISLDGETSKDIQGISPVFAAPEQCEKASALQYGQRSSIVLDSRMDTYSLGAVFYSVMTGVLPPSLEQMQPDLFAMDIPYSNGIRAIVSKAMRKKISARFSSAHQMKAALLDVGRMDPLYKRYGHLQIVSLLIGFLCIVTGSLFLYYGGWKNGIEKWQQAYKDLYLCVEAEDETEIVSQATEMLNASVYRGYLKSHEEKKAEVLHVLGDSYFRQESFKDAALYYEEAWAIEPSDGSYCKDYAIALVRDGHTGKAREILASSEEGENLSQGETLLIQAEISKIEEDVIGTMTYLEKLKKLNGRGTDAEVSLRGYLLEASIYEGQEEYGQAAEVLETAAKLTDSKEVLRYYGQLAAKAASVSSRTAEQNAYLQKALACYKSLNSSSKPSYEDQLNLALTERALGKYEESNNTLRTMNQTYKEDYKIPMWMCYNYLNQAKEQSSYDEVMKGLWFRYADCKNRFSLSDQQDQDMEALIEIMENLKE